MSSVSLVVSVGTDHHRFDRLARWVESWLDGTRLSVRCVYQHGSSSAPAHCTPIGLVSRDEMVAHMRSATVVLTQAGPGSIKDAHESGHTPIVVPRRAALDEVVDDHQVEFSRAVSGLGWAVSVESESDLHAALDAAFRNPEAMRWTASATDQSDATVRAFAGVVKTVVSSNAGGLRLSRVPQAVRLASAVLRGTPASVGSNPRQAGSGR